MKTIESVLETLADIRHYAKDIVKIRELLSCNLPESDFLQKASQINREVGYYIVSQLYQDGDPKLFEQKLKECEIPFFHLKFIKFLDMPARRIDEQHFNDLRKKLIKEGMSEEQWILETSKTYVYLTQQWISKKYREKDPQHFKYLCKLINWEIDEFFPLLRKIANESRKIQSMDRSTKGYGGVI